MLFKNSVRTSKRAPHFTITKINWLTLFKFKNTTLVPYETLRIQLHELRQQMKTFLRTEANGVVAQWDETQHSCGVLVHKRTRSYSVLNASLLRD
jgi:hypothetical protein